VLGFKGKIFMWLLYEHTTCLFFYKQTKNKKQKQFIAPIFLLPENQIWLWGHYSNIENGKKNLVHSTAWMPNNEIKIKTNSYVNILWCWPRYFNKFDRKSVYNRKTIFL
jgi:hypothetical protein